MTAPRLHGAAAESHAAGEARRQAEARQRAEAAEDTRAAGRVVAALASRVMGVPAPDALAALARQAGGSGPADAARVLRMAGLGLPPRTAPAPPPAASPWSRSPDHDPRVMAALAGGAGEEELARVRRDVAAEYGAAAASRQPSPEMWRARDGQVVTDDSVARARPQASRPFPRSEEKT